MKNSITYPRCSGILAHLTSLPSPYGIGDMGPGAYSFLRFLQKSEQSIWQVLPLGPTAEAFAHSPYMTFSAFAGNPLLISPELLYEEGYISKTDLNDQPLFSPYSVDFEAVSNWKTKLLHIAFTNFTEKIDPSFSIFLQEADWLEDYCLFRVLKDYYNDKPWYSWDSSLAKREPLALQQVGAQLSEKIRFYQFEQYLFSRQWQKLHGFANECGVQIFGDIPIYVSLDSADVWSHQNIFMLEEKSRLPTHVAGVPPDYFSETGQKWGNPLYRWNSSDEEVNKSLMQWWFARFQRVFEQVDIVRIDHFRGFESYWSVPAEHETALKGKWCKGPAAEFFLAVFEKLGPLKIVAEDLGEITEEVNALRDELGFPGMKVLQFAFDGNMKNDFLPFNYTSSNFFVYTGTHDNDTSVGWFLGDKIDDGVRQRVKSLANRDLHDGHGIHRDLIYLAMSSIAAVCILPLQDVLGFGSDCRMNTPGTSEGNWVWRCGEEFLTENIASWLAWQTGLFRRSPEKDKNQQEKLSSTNATNP